MIKKVFLIFSLFFLNVFIHAQEFLPLSFKAELKQVSYGSLSGKEKSSLGALDYKYPSELRLEIFGPEKITLVIGKELTWYYVAPFSEKDMGELTINKTKKTLVTALLDSLKNGLVANKLYTVRKENDLKYILMFSQQEASDLGIASVELTFKTKVEFEDLKELMIFKVDKSKLKFEFLKLKTNVSFKKDYFKFKAPENTRISQ